VSASIKITLYSDEGPAPEIQSLSSSREEASRIEWLALVGTAKHLLRGHREHLPAPQLAALKALVTFALVTEGDPDVTL